jgi:hypothetical protein
VVYKWAAKGGFVMAQWDQVAFFELERAEAKRAEQSRAPPNDRQESLAFSSRTRLNRISTTI